MHDLIAITALGASAARVDQVGPVTLSEQPDWAFASVAARLGQDSTCKTALKKLLGVAAPDVGRVHVGKDLTAFWTGPDQWMIEAPYDRFENLAAQVKSAVGGAASVTEQTDGWCRFDLDGDGIVPVFERLCNVNVAAMETDTATRTVIEHLGCFLVCRDAGKHLSVIGPRSSAGSMHHALLSAMRSVW